MYLAFERTIETCLLSKYGFSMNQQSFFHGKPNDEDSIKLCNNQV